MNSPSCGLQTAGRISKITGIQEIYGMTTLLSFDEMMSHLLTLYKLGADGCFIWTSSQTRDSNGNKFYIDVNSGWGKAIVDFIAK